MVLGVALTAIAAHLERPDHVISQSISLQGWWAQLASRPSMTCAGTESGGFGVMRTATESECLAAAKAAAAYAGLGEVRHVKAVDPDATTVPHGCSYSHVSKAAVFNRNPMGACASSTDCLYDIICVVDGADAGVVAAAEAEAKDEEEAEAGATAAAAEELAAFDAKLAQALEAPAWPKPSPRLPPTTAVTTFEAAVATFDDTKLAQALLTPAWPAHSSRQPPTPALATFDDRPCDEWTGTSAARTEKPLTCGVLWFLHIPKTGGTTLMRHFHANKGRNGWRYANMWKNPVPEEERGAPGSGHQWATWNISREWTHVVLDELAKPKPKLIVHSHHNMPGLGDAYMRDAILHPMAKSMRSKGCGVRFVTVLREPVAEIVSLMMFRHVPPSSFVECVEKNAEATSKYIMYNFRTQWPEMYRTGVPTQEEGEALLQAGQDVLHNFSLVGRTDQLDDFVADINVMLGWPARLTAAPVRTGRQGQESDAETRSSWVPYEPNATQLARVREANIFDSLLYHSFCASNSSVRGERRATALVANRPRRPDGLALLDRVLGNRRPS